MKTRLLLAVMALVTLVVASTSSYQFVRSTEDDQRRALIAAARLGANTLAADAQALADEAEGIRDCLEGGPLTDANVTHHLRSALVQHEVLYGAGYTATPSAQGQLYAPYLRRPFGTIERTDVDYDPTLEPRKGTTDPDTNWFRGPADSPVGVWVEPFFGRKSQTPLVAYGLGMGEETQRAVISLNLSLASMHELVSHMDLGELGYAYLASASGSMIVHPRPDLVELRARDRDLSQWLPEQTGKMLVEAFEDPLTDRQAWRVCTTVEGPSWRLCVVGDKLPPTQALTLRRKLTVLLTLAAAVLVLVIVLLRPGRASWKHSAGLTAASTGLVAAIWVLLYLSPTYDYKTFEEERHTREAMERAGQDPMEGASPLLIVTSESSVKQHIEAYTQAGRTEVASETLVVKTGVYLQSLDFVDANDVAVTGYVWQRGEGATGLIMPEAVDGDIDE